MVRGWRPYAVLGSAKGLAYGVAPRGPPRLWG